MGIKMEQHEAESKYLLLFPYWIQIGFTGHKSQVDDYFYFFREDNFLKILLAIGVGSMWRDGGVEECPWNGTGCSAPGNQGSEQGRAKVDLPQLLAAPMRQAPAGPAKPQGIGGAGEDQAPQSGLFVTGSLPSKQETSLEFPVNSASRLFCFMLHDYLF